MLVSLVSRSLLPLVLSLVSRFLSIIPSIKGPCGAHGRKTGRMLVCVRGLQDIPRTENAATMVLFLATTVWQHLQFRRCELPRECDTQTIVCMQGGSNRLHRSASRSQQTATEWPAVRVIITQHTSTLCGLHRPWADATSDVGAKRNSQLSERKGREARNKRARRTRGGAHEARGAGQGRRLRQWI